MIPMSRAYLHTKFGGENIFKSFISSVDSCFFPYVIYSNSSLTKFIKTLKRKGEKNKPEKLESENQPESSESIYFKFLKALSSKATVRPVFYKPSLIESLKGKSPTIEIEPEPNNAKSGIRKKIGKNRGKFSDSSPNELDNSFRANQGGEDLVFEMIVQLETRTSMTVPKFSYEKMQDDSKIKNFKERIRKKLIRKSHSNALNDD